MVDIVYGIHQTPFGRGLIGIIKKRICYFLFIEKSELNTLKHLQKLWPDAFIVHNNAITKEAIKTIFLAKRNKRQLKVIMKGSNFQSLTFHHLKKKYLRGS